MEFLQLMYFKTVAEYGKIITAAEALYITPPALSSSISRLEKELNLKLFERTNNSITLNEQGVIFLRYANQILANLDNAKLELQQSLQKNEPHIHVAMTTSNLWIQLLSAFSQEFPHIMMSNTTLKLSQIPAADLFPSFNCLLAEEHDLEHNKFESIPLITDDRPVLVVHPSHTLAGRSSIDLREVNGEIFLLPVADMSLHRMANNLLNLAGISTNNLYEYSYMLRRKMILSGRGISFSTEYTSRGEDPSLCYIPIEIPSCSLTHRLFWDKGRKLSPEAISFLDYAVEYFNIDSNL